MLISYKIYKSCEGGKCIQFLTFSKCSEYVDRHTRLLSNITNASGYMLRSKVR